MVIKPIKALIEGYLSRHRNNIDRILHIIGIPLVLFGIFQAILAKWIIGISCFVAGYVLQWIGHTYFEKNEVGEWILIKKIVRKLTGG